MPPAVSKKQLMSELFEALENNDFQSFSSHVRIAKEVGIDFEEIFGPETGYKTILQLAIEEEEEGYPYVEELVKAGASTSFYNQKNGNCPIHVAANEASLDIIQLLLRYSHKKADVNVYNSSGLSAFHILLTKLMDLATYEMLPMSNRGDAPLTDDMITSKMINIVKCLELIVKQKDLRIDFNNGYPHILYNEKSEKSLKKLTTMTPLQILCSFQSWNARMIAPDLHEELEKVIEMVLERPDVDPNATAAKGILAGTVAGSTPPVLLAATRGYFRVVEIFKNYYNTNFLIENKFRQTILHVVLKAGYYNKYVVYGDDSANGNIETIKALFSKSNLAVQAQMKSIINRKDTYGNTALHYAKSYGDQSIVKFLLYNGAKIDINPQKVVNVHHKTLEQYFYEKCIIVEGDDIDDEDFKIRVNFQLFEKPVFEAGDNLEQAKEKASAWSLELGKTQKENASLSSGKVDTARLELFSDMEVMHDLLKHPVLLTFLELELTSLKFWYILDFVFYTAFVIILFASLTSKYGIFEIQQKVNQQNVVYSNASYGNLTYYILLLMGCVGLLLIRELWQLFKMKLRYFTSWENIMELCVIVLVVLNIIPLKFLHFMETQNLHRHLSALTMLIALTQLYMLLVKVFPNTSLPIYVNMFTTVMRTYIFILMSYLAFLMSFAYCFFLIFGGEDISNGGSSGAGNTTVIDDGIQNISDLHFETLGLSMIKTLVMFVGEMNYTDLKFTHWLGYVIFALFVFLVIIVLLNVLNGLAVRDIGKIQEEIGTYQNISIIETLSGTIFLSMVAQEVVLQPNIKPTRQTIMKIPLPGQKVYKALGGKHNFDLKDGKSFYIKESTVKSAKELVALKQKQSQSLGKPTLESVSDTIMELSRDFQVFKTRMASQEDNINAILEIMASRNAAVGRF